MRSANETTEIVEKSLKSRMKHFLNIQAFKALHRLKKIAENLEECWGIKRTDHKSRATFNAEEWRMFK